MSMIKPLKGKILAHKLDKKDYNIQLITKDKVPDCGIIDEVGSAPISKKGKWLPWPYKKGDVVYFRRHTHTPYKESFFVKHTAIMCYIRDKNMYSANDYVIVAMEYGEKIGSIYVPPSRNGTAADFIGRVVSIDRDLDLDDKIYILRMEGGIHEGIKIEIDRRTYWAIQRKWIYAKQT